VVKSVAKREESGSAKRAARRKVQGAIRLQIQKFAFSFPESDRGGFTGVNSKEGGSQLLAAGPRPHVRLPAKKKRARRKERRKKNRRGEKRDLLTIEPRTLAAEKDVREREKC